MESTYTAFEGQKMIAQGELSEVVMKVKKQLGRADSHDVLIFSDDTGKTMDFSFQGSEKDILKRLEVYAPSPKRAPLAANSGPGRPGWVSFRVKFLYYRDTGNGWPRKAVGLRRRFVFWWRKPAKKMAAA